MITASIIFIILILTFNYLEYKKIAAAKKVRFKFSLVTVVAIAVIVTSLPLIMATFFIYRQVLNLILRIKYGAKYGGLLEGTDAAHTVHGPSIIHILFFMEQSSETSQSFHETLRTAAQKVITEKLKGNIKFFGIVRKFAGYAFVIKDEVTVMDCFKTLKTTNNPGGEITENELMDIISDSSDIPLPKEETALWDVFVGTQSLKQETKMQDKRRKVYPVLIRLQHCMVDGYGAIVALPKLLVEDKSHIDGDNKETLHPTKLKTRESTNKTKSMKTTPIIYFLQNAVVKVLYYLNQFRLMLSLPAWLLVNSLIKEKAPHILTNGPRLSSKKLLSFHTEKTPAFFQAIRRIKKKIPGSTFNSICKTAIAGALAEYFKQNGDHCPDSVLVIVPHLQEMLRVTKPSANITKDSKIQCRNRFSCTMQRLPVGLGSHSNDASLIEMLRLVTDEGKCVKATAETEIHYWLLSVLGGLLPLPFFRIILDYGMQSTAAFSNMVVPPNLTFLGYPLLNAYGWPPNLLHIGLSIGVVSYGEHLQLSIVVDALLISDISKAQRILDGIGAYIERLDSICNNSSAIV